MIPGVLVTVLALVGMIVWSLHEIRRVDDVIEESGRPSAGDEEGADGQG